MREVFIELNTACNFDCEFCTYHLLTRKKEVLSLDGLRHILEQLKKIKDIDYVMFSAMGEPLLHPYFIEACRMVKNYGFKLIVTTNGSLLREKHKNLPIDDIYISLHTTSEKSFIHRRAKNITFTEYLNIIKEFVKGEHPRTTIYLMGTGLYPQTRGNTGYTNNELDYDNIEKSLAIINEYGTFFETSFQKLQHQKCNFLYNKFIYLRPNLNFYLRFLYNWSNFILPPKCKCVLAPSNVPLTCYPDYDYYNKHINILANGDVTFCCMDFDGIMVQGNIFQESLESLLAKKEKVRNLAQYDLCRQCRGQVVSKDEHLTKQ